MTALSKPYHSLSKTTLGFALLATAAVALPGKASADTDGWDLLVGAAAAYAVYDAVGGDGYVSPAHHYTRNGWHGGFYYRDGYRFHSKRDYKRWRKHQRRLAKQRRRAAKHYRKRHGGYYDGAYCPYENRRLYSDPRSHRRYGYSHRY